MLKRSSLALLAALPLGACATSETPNNFTAERSIFASPYVEPVIAGRTSDGGVFYPGAGRYAYDRAGNRIRLRGDERRDARRQADAIEEQARLNQRVEEFEAQQTDAIPAVPSPPPISSDAPSRGGGSLPR